MKKNNYLVSVQDPRHPQTEPFVFSASDSDISSILIQFAGCVVIIRNLKSYTNLKPQNDETSSEKESC
nr:MAG TPA: hypothetical protein [Microviridae sp.]